MIFLPEQLVPVHVLEPAADAGGRTGVWVNLKNYHRAYVVFYMNQGNAATAALSINQATSAAGAGSKVLANAVPIFTNLDQAAGVAFTKQTAAVNYTTDAGVKKKMVMFLIDPLQLDVAGGFTYITAITGASNAANITSAFILLVPRIATINAQSVA